MISDENHNAARRKLGPEMSKEFERPANQSDRLNRTRALLIGFSLKPVANITEALEAVGWMVVSAQDSGHAAHEYATEQFDFVLIDVDGVDQFAPGLIGGLRSGASMNSGATIVAFSNYFMPAFKDRLNESGVDGFCSFPLHPGVLVASLTEASVCRARSANAVGPGHSW